MNMYKEALLAQSACNLSGIVRSLANHTEEIWTEARAAGKGTDYVNRHPVVVLFAAQIVFLSTGGSIDTAAYSKAYDECNQKSN